MKRKSLAFILILIVCPQLVFAACQKFIEGETITAAALNCLVDASTRLDELERYVFKAPKRYEGNNGQVNCNEYCRNSQNAWPPIMTGSTCVAAYIPSLNNQSEMWVDCSYSSRDALDKGRSMSCWCTPPLP